VFLEKHWKKVEQELLKLRPDIKIEQVLFKTLNNDSYDRKKYPEGLAIWGGFFPGFVMVPGDVWERASNDKTAPMGINDGAEGMNLTFKNGQLATTRGYNYDASGVIAWATNTLNQPKFETAPLKKTGHTVKPPAQQASPSPAKLPMPVVPNVIVEMAQKPPMMEKPKLSPYGQVYGQQQVAIPALTTPLMNTNKNIVKTSSSRVSSSSETVGINVCNIRLVSRPPNR